MADNNETKRLEKLKERNREIISHSGNYSPMEIIEGGMAKKYSTKREFWRIFLWAIGGAVVFSVLVAVAAMVFRIEKITVTNETDFSAPEVIKASGIKNGENLILLSKSAVSSRIAENIPYASDISVTKIFPSAVKISMKKGAGKYYTKIGKEYYVIDEDFTVIARTTKIEDIEMAGCIRIQSGKISRCMMGKKLLFRDTDMQGVLEELIMNLEKYGYTGFYGDIIIDSKFDIMFTWNGRFTVRLGDLKDMDVKFQFLEKIKESLSDKDSGIINVSDSDLHEAIVTLHE